MTICAGIKRDGGRCTAVVGASQTHCYQHDPARASERRSNAALGGRSKASREVRGLKLEIKALIADVKAKSLDRNDAQVMIQGYRALRDFIDLERRWKETEELEARLEALEQAEGVRGWGA
jgi:ParB-like chromosome segregation protein Spo0J